VPFVSLKECLRWFAIVRACNDIVLEMASCVLDSRNLLGTNNSFCYSLFVLRTETMKNAFSAINLFLFVCLFSPLGILCLIPFTVVRYKFHTLCDGTRKQAVGCKEALTVLCWKSPPPPPSPHDAPIPSGPGRLRYRYFTIILRHTTVGRTSLDEWSARRRDLYLTTHNTHKRLTSMPPSGFESAISASERRQTYALDRAATAIGCWNFTDAKYCCKERLEQ
jgi:hypothetical protein